MTRVIEVPAHFDDRSFDSFAEGFGEWPPEEKLLFDARGTQWASPYGLIGLLTAGQALAEAKRERPLLTVPTSDEVKRYWARAGFFLQAAELFELHGKVPRSATTGPSDVLLDVTPVRASEDVHGVVDKISEGASRILHGELGLEMKATLRFSMALSEACQNIVEHAGTSGWVAVQAYTFRRRLGRRVVVIAVSDGGVGFRRSLESTHAKRFGERWGDGAALEAALIQGVSRFRDPGRGQGLAFIKRFLDQWEGKISIRSGTARLAIVPPWDEDVPLTDRLPVLPRLPGPDHHPRAERGEAMIQTIRIGHLLREAVAAPYRNLVTRPTGAAVRTRIEETLARSECLTALLDFSEIELVDLSCADEVVAKLLLAGRTACFVVLQGLREDHHEAIDHVLIHNRLAVTAVPPGSREPRLLGWVADDARRAFACIGERGPLSVADLSRMLGWLEARSRAALRDLALNRLVRPVGELYHPLPTA